MISGSELASIELFRGIAASSREAIARTCTAVDIVEGELVFRQGGRPSRLHMLLQGRVVLIASSATNETVVEMFDAGETFLLPAVLLARPYLVSARAVADCRLATMAAVDFT